MERLPNGDAVLKVTTAASVAEPYLDLLVEVNWASGRVVRAYTFLLDPPGATVPIAPVEPVTPPRAGAGAPRAAAAGTQAAPAPRASGEARGGASSYGPSRRHAVEDCTKPSRSATLEQMLVAL
jgi:pilus assembly protein FimV